MSKKAGGMKYRTKAAVLIGPSKIETQELDMPPLGARDILVKVEMAGVCGSDIHLYSSERPFGEMRGWTYPQILGHENIGTILEIGKEADTKDAGGQTLEVGDRVAVGARGVVGKTDILLNGFRGWSTYLYAAEGSRFYKYPKDMPSEVIVLTEPLSIGVRAVMRAQLCNEPYTLRGLFPGSSAVVQGLGPIGLLTLIMAKLAGAEQVIGIDVSELRLNMAKEFGADQLINPNSFKTPQELYTKVRELSTYGTGPDVVFEAAGVPALFAQAISMVKRGGTVVELGHWTARGTYPVDPYEVCIKDLDILGSAGAGSAWPGGDWELSRRVLRANYRKIPFGKLVTHKFPVEKAEEAIATARQGKCMKAVIVPQ